MITVSAPGKVHLLGEHSVVYGKPALLAAINLRLYASIQPSESMNIPTMGRKLVQHSIDVFKHTYHLETLEPFTLEISTTIPVGCGLGSSAAVAVATLGALHVFFKKGWNVDVINTLAYEVEKKQHTNPSGGDNTVVTYGGFLWYRKEFEFLKSVWQLPFKPHKNIKQFFLIQSGKPAETTGKMVEIVKGKLRIEKYELRIKELFNQQEELTKKMAIALKEGDENALMDAMSRGEKNLEELGVVGNVAEQIIKAVEHSGGAAKISGAGGIKNGSGMVLCCHPNPEQLRVVANKNKWELLPIQIGEEGIRKEITNDQ